jgi:hypothetical protein
VKLGTDKKLRGVFNIFNEKYFEGKIRDNIEIRYGNNEDCENCDGLASCDFIYVHEDFKRHPDMGLIILLHEMQHCHMLQKGYNDWKEEGGHHMLFYAGIDRIYKMGGYEGLL